MMIHYVPSYDLSLRSDRKGIWTDHYKAQNLDLKHKYEVRVYESFDDLVSFLSGTSLKLVDEIHNFNRDEVMEPGWIDFILEKQVCS